MNDTDALNNTWSVITPDTIPWTMPFYRKNLIFRPFPDTHGDPYAIFSFQCDDGIDKSIIATIAIKVTSVNGAFKWRIYLSITLTLPFPIDHPTMNFTSLDILAYEDSEVTITLDIKDVDLNDRLLVKITDIIVNGTLYHFDRRTNSRTQLTIGEGSEIAGPPYVIVFRPTPDFYSETVDSIQKFNVTFTDLSGAGSSHQVNFSVLPVNDRPIIDCVSNSIELPLDFVITSFGEYNFTIEVTDVDNAQVNFVLVKAPQQGYLSAEGIAFAENSQFTTKQLSFHSNNSGGGYPYSYFSVYAVDDAGAVSNTCTFQFTFTCPPRKFFPSVRIR
ncbi:hypothetical protein BKA69DRAFT_711899 [Paraphysoderma sedebokerense]|nr:hypothetical protein BKA69DRAFT_152558 [Paraphysoderma sedebokerense]KAI9138956.1 hypothetical protein BKA69DRAFT_711899 [Paraphysoderma sedebokerense]